MKNSVQSAEPSGSTVSTVSPWREVAEAGLLLSCVVLPFVPLAWAGSCCAVVLLLWLASRPPKREVYVAGVFLLIAAALLAGGWYEGRKPPLSKERWLAAAGDGYRGLWQDLDLQVKSALRLLPPLPSSLKAEEVALRQTLFKQLTAAVEERSGAGATVVLLDGEDEVVAWAGEGLLHGLAPYSLPREGRTYRASYGSITLLAVHPLTTGRRSWRLVAGRSLPAEKLPFAAPGPRRREAFRWSLIDDLEQANPGTWVLEEAETPSLVVEFLASYRRDSETLPANAIVQPNLFRRGALGAIALALLGLAVLRGVGLALRPMTSEGPSRARRFAVVLLGLGGVGAGALAAGVSWVVAGALLLGLSLAVLGLQDGQSRGPAIPLWIKSAGAAGLLAVSAWLVQWQHGSAIDLSTSIGSTPTALCLRVAFWAAALGLFLLASRTEENCGENRDRWAWAAIGLLGLAAVFHDFPMSSLLLAAGGWWAGVTWYSASPSIRRTGRLAAVVALSALAAATAWETSFRLQLQAQLGSETLQRMAPPEPDQLEALRQEVQRHFSFIDPRDLAPRSTLGLDSKDLAFLLWKNSPLARYNAVSALVVEPGDDLPAGFAFGMSLSSGLEDATLPADSQELPGWDELVATGGVALSTGSKGWWLLRYWLVPRPGFSLHNEAVSGEVAGGLQAEGGLGRQAVVGLPRSVAFGLYSGATGRTLISPWEEAPPLPPELASRDSYQGVVDTTVGRAWTFARRGLDGWEVLYLPQLSPAAALDRVGTPAAGVLLVALIGVVIFFLLALPRPAFRSLLMESWRSYAKRLLIVYTLFLVVPLVLLNVALIASFKERLWRQQRAAGERALVSAQVYLVDYLQALPPGFGIDTAFGDRLRWLSDIVRHEINFYWGSRESEIVSSRPELFAAGLLPKRIPGEVYSRLTLGGYNLASRDRIVGDTRYVELYAPLRLPGASSAGGGSFFLSMPLLAQQAEAAEELSHLRRQALLLTAALFALLVIVGGRLARGFAAPITELVEGTRRIAGGAESLNMSPSDLELAALVEAVDEMARRVARSRERQLREKQVVERIVQHITSGVISLDAEGRVLMLNRVAKELIGVEVGQALDEALTQRPQLAPVATFVAGCGRDTRQGTVKIHEPEGGEGEREWALVWVPVPGSGDPATLLVLEDATEVLRGQRLEAWAEMARIIAHEIKNPLTPIRLSAEHMKQVYASDPEHFDEVFARCNSNILRQVDELQQIASEFSTYSSILPKEGDLVEAVEELVDSYRAAPPPGIEVRFEAEVKSLPARFDARLLGRAMRNLLENAVRATSGGGIVEVRVSSSGEEARISVADEGPGVDPALLARIFDPYFSTHDSGTGLGLPIARRVAEEHGGTITAQNRSPKGLEVVICLPLRGNPSTHTKIGIGFLT